ncbi:DNA cytosine methyltransferase [Herbaspirillum seropedicae]|uniref:DNA cytosine methyltransferase n=1 Tax=Herbaspirillum seropedicae TaxID=964 RepID=UPI00286406DF|nr:DNA cytosine methyltransferase [Herbaspirillum seropedicae]MDR6397271.1 DNA (cytosine-5)-methyltransferase 1 [Herbaspirillum seropedicae]
MKFIDVFAGCGGLSLGLTEAQHKGVFAIERSALAFSTLKHNLVTTSRQNAFDWPSWLPQEAMTCEDLISEFSNQIGQLRGEVDLIVGGPPCQGFSTAGKRNANDPRNKMTEQYLALVGLIMPRFLVIENVAGYNMRFEKNKATAEAKCENSKEIPYAQAVKLRLEEMGYHVSSGLVNCANFGVPQRRERFLMLCERIDNDQAILPDLFKRLKKSRKNFLRYKNLPHRQITTREAIADLKTRGKTLVASSDSPARGFLEATYRAPKRINAYLALMKIGASGKAPDSRRLANHKPATIEHFKKVRRTCRPGFCLSINERETVGTRKHSITVLDPARPAPTITTLPDDILHYSEPRILTVRENARLQSFPDWFSFQGKYTTGGKSRKQECPRYTQVGNAVPPLLAEAIGMILAQRENELNAFEQDAAHELHVVA